MRKPKANPDQMTSQVRLLFETGLVKDLSRKELADFVGVPVRTLQNWLAGGLPQKRYEGLISDGLARIDAAHPDPTWEEIRPGVFVTAARWGKKRLLEDLEDTAVKKAKAAAEKAEDEYYELMAEAKRGVGKRAAVEPGLALELDGIEADNRANPSVWPSLTGFLFALKPQGMKLADYAKLLRAYLRAIGIVDVPKK